MKDIRCGQCDKLLAKGEAAMLSIKCPRCKTINYITTATSHTAERTQRRNQQRDRI